MKNLLFTLLIMSSTVLFSQNENDTLDNMIDDMCADFKLNENLKDDIRFEILNQKFIYEYLSRFPEAEQEEKINELFYRFQRRCEHYRAYLMDGLPVENENWERLYERPEVTITDEEIDFFKEHTSFYYLEYSGERTEVETNKKYWIDTYADGTYSKSHYSWIDKTRFELKFIESNNAGRQNYNREGDRYSYQVIAKEADFYWLLVEIPGQSEILKFKLFVKK